MAAERRGGAGLGDGWELVATRPGGSITSLAVVDEVVLAATPAGLRRSRDGGRSWTVIGEALVPPLELAVPAPSFGRDGRMLGGTANGLYRSVDGGASWSAALVGGRVLAIAFATDDLVLVGTEDDGILRSEDGGQTWKSGNPGLLDLTVLGLACSPRFAVDQTALAATSSGLFRTRNGGRAWRAVETVPGEPVIQCVAALDGALVLGTTADDNSDGLLRSTDDGRTWQAAPAFAGRSVTALAHSATGERLAAATDAGAAISDDAGASWRWVAPSKTSPVLSVAFAADGALLAGLARQGVVRSTDGVRWEAMARDVQANLTVALAIAADRHLYLAGLEDGLVVSSDGGTTWSAVRLGDDDGVAVFGLSTDARYAATARGVFRWSASGWTCVSRTPARAVASSGERVAALGLAGEVLRSTDGGRTWQPTVAPPAGGPPSCLGLVTDGTVLVGTPAGVWQATTAGGWQRILAATHAVPTCVLPAPTYTTTGTAFVGLGTQVWWPARGWQEVERGERRPSWQRTELAARVIALAVAPTFARERIVAAGTSTGMALSRDAGARFTPWSDGLGRAPMVAVAASPTFASDRLLYAVELGGRLWRRGVTPS